MALEFFSRREQKYLSTRKQYEMLVDQMSPYMRYDKFGDNGFEKYTDSYVLRQVETTNHWNNDPLYICNS